MKPEIRSKRAEDRLNIITSKPLQNIKVYWHDKNPSLETFKTIIETYGGILINDHNDKNCIVICEKTNEKFIKSMNKNGIACYSKDLIFEGVKKQNLDYEKYANINF